MGSWKSGLANALTTRPTPQPMKPLDQIQSCGMIEKNAEIATPVLRPRVLFGWQNALPVMLELGRDSSPLSELNQLLSRESARGGLAEPSFMCGCRTRVQLVCNTASRPNKWVRLRAPPKKDRVAVASVPAGNEEKSSYVTVRVAAGNGTLVA